MTEQADAVTIPQLKAIMKTHALYGTLKLLFELAKEDCEKFAEAGNMEAVIHQDTIFLMRAIKQMQRSPASAGGAFVRQLDEIEEAKCHKQL